MSWPKSKTRRLHIEGQEFLWHLKQNRIDHNPVLITVGQETGKHYLWIDPYVHDFEVTPANIKQATIWALENGWSPQSGPSRTMSFSMANKEFYWLSEGTKFGYELRVIN